MSAYQLENGTVVIFLGQDPLARNEPCPVCGPCCTVTDEGACAGAYEGLCHTIWEEAGATLP